MDSHSTEIFTTLFNTFWNVFSSKITNADDIKSVVEESFHESQVLDRSRYIFLKSRIWINRSILLRVKQN